MPAATTAPRIAFYGDDFTGATDSLATATLGGLRSLLFLGVPQARQLQAAGPLDCLGIAGAARSMTPAQMQQELMPVVQFLARVGAPVTHYKICSTFDSSPAIGSIGSALRLWHRHVVNPFVPIIGGQPNLRRYCVFSQLHAAAQGGDAVVRIDRHPTMSRHPVTPMHEADLRRHLQAQQLRVAALHYPDYADERVLAARLDEALRDQPDAVLFDVSRSADLAVIGRLLWARAQQAPLLAVGASSVIQSLLAAWEETSVRAVAMAPSIAPAQGPVLVLAGSLSPLTAAQIEGARSYRKILLDAQKLCESDMRYRHASVQETAALLRRGIPVLACTSTPAGSRLCTPQAAQRLAHAGGQWLREVLQTLPLRRVGVAGGDTSSHALRALDVWGLSYRGQLAPGVALCRAHADAPHLEGMELMLKGGQMGQEDLFERLLLGSPAARIN